MKKFFSDLFHNEHKAGIIYFVAIIGILVGIWLIIVTNAIQVQRESADKYYTSPPQPVSTE